MASHSDPEISKKRASKRKHKSHDSTNAVHHPRYSIARRSGGRFSNLPPVFSKDEKYVFLCTKHQARVYSTRNGDLVRALSHTRTQKSTIVAIFLHPSNEYRLILVSLDGLVTTWDWTDGALLQTVSISPPTQVVCAIIVRSTFLWTDGRTIFMCNDFPTLKNTHQISQLSVCVGLAANKEHIFAYGEKSVMIFSLRPSGTTTEHEYLTLPSTLSSFALSNDHFAYSDANGAIFVQPVAPFQENKDVTPRRFHWHSSAVSTLRFALDGEYLLSGGQEGVLVLWQMSTSNKQFLPRVARHIESIGVSSKSTCYALKLNDNTVKLVAATNLNLQAEVVGPRYTSGKLASAALGDDVILCNGADAQVWNIPTGRTSLRLPVTVPSFGNRVKDLSKVNESAVECCAAYEQWLGTIDAWCTSKEEAVDFGYTKPRDEVYLKFWKFNGTDYDLVTRIDNPHGEARVMQIIAANDGSFFTAGEDAAVKIWRRKAVKKDLIGGGTETVGTTWSCRRVLKFARLHGLCRMALAPDCTVLGLYSGDQVFIVDVNSGALRTTVCTNLAGRVNSLGFVKSSLVIVGYKKLMVWDLLSTSAAYALRVPEGTSEMLLTCGDKDFMLSTNEQSRYKSNAKIFIFEPKSAKPIFREKCPRTLALTWSPVHGYMQTTVDLEVVQIAVTATTPVISTAEEVKIPIAIHTGLSSTYRLIKDSVPQQPVVNDSDMQETVLNTQSVTKVLEDPMRSLESKFEDLAALVLGLPSKAFDSR